MQLLHILATRRVIALVLCIIALFCTPAFAANITPTPVIKPQKKAIPFAYSETIKVKKGGTLDEILSKAEVKPEERQAAIHALRPYFKPSSIRLGQSIELFLTKKISKGRLSALRVYTSKRKFLEVQQHTDGTFGVVEAAVPVSSKLIAEKVTIKSTLFGAAQKQHIPVKIIHKMIKLLSYDVDFQRDIYKDDSFSILYEKHYDDDDAYVDSGNIIYLSLSLRKKDIEMYRFTTPNGITSYFNPEGDSIEKSLLMTPVDGYRITSGFGMRKHPILGYTRMHKGTDFGAPSGTPIYAAGSGKVARVGNNGGYGRYIKLNHGNGYATAYAHMSRFARGIYKGMSIKQGDIIGYVGMTGRATGPHLHYEVLINGRQVNPLSIKSPPRTKIKGVGNAIYRYYKKQIHALMAGVLSPD
jgi:murein DD-endopeptidase MepM/ murein hydrolase activator NlpD